MLSPEEGRKEPKKGGDSSHSHGKKTFVQTDSLRHYHFLHYQVRVTYVISDIRTSHWKQEHYTHKGSPETYTINSALVNMLSVLLVTGLMRQVLNLHTTG